jgi:hypothetical protein
MLLLLLLLLLLLQIFDHGLPWRLQLLPLQLHAAINSSSSSSRNPTNPVAGTAAAAAAATGANNTSNSSGEGSSGVRCLKLVVGLTEGLLQGAGGWRRSPAAALLFKVLKPINADEGGSTAAASAISLHGIADVNLRNHP